MMSDALRPKPEVVPTQFRRLNVERWWFASRLDAHIHSIERLPDRGATATRTKSVV
jgi:hypothetical protein